MPKGSAICRQGCQSENRRSGFSSRGLGVSPLQLWAGIAMTADRQLWLVEGLPGSGKSTTSDLLCEAARNKGWAANWWLEELRDHPVLPSSLRRSAYEAGFPRLCVQAFSDFLSRETGVLILDGAALQSTVRFLFAKGASQSAISQYVVDWTEVVSPYTPRMLMLTISDPFDHFADFVRHRRGTEWTTKLIAYVESTPLAMDRRWTGFLGLVAFWSGYQDLCFDVLRDLPFPVLSVAAQPASASGLSSEILTHFGFSD